MRKHYFSLSIGIFAMLVLAHLGLVSCSDDPESEVITYKVSADKESLTFDYNSTEAQTVSVTVTPAAEWSLEETDEWITCEKSGNTLSVSVAENTEVLRQSTITIKVDKSGQAEVATTTLTIVQEAAPGSSGTPLEPNVNVTFDAATGTYIGVSEAGYTGEYTIELTKDDKTLTIVAFDELAPIPARFLATAGEYQGAGTYDFNTFAVGSLNKEQTIVGTSYKYGSREVVVKEGSFSLTYDAGEYTLTANMKGEDADYNQHEMEFSFTGEIPFTSDYEPEYLAIDSDVFASHYGDQDSDGITRFKLLLTTIADADDYNKQINIPYLYTENVDREDLYIPSGTYRIGEERAHNTMPPGRISDDGREILNTSYAHRHTSGIDKENILAQYGSMIVEYDESNRTYEIYGHFAGHNLATQKAGNVAFKYSGSFGVSDMMPSEMYTLTVHKTGTFGIPSATFTLNHYNHRVYRLTVSDNTQSEHNLTANVYLKLPDDHEKGVFPLGTFPVASSEAATLEFEILPGTPMGIAWVHSHLSVSDKFTGMPHGTYLFKEGSLKIEKSTENELQYKITGAILSEEATRGVISEIVFDVDSQIRLN